MPLWPVIWTAIHFSVVRPVHGELVKDGGTHQFVPPPILMIIAACDPLVMLVSWI